MRDGVKIAIDVVVPKNLPSNAKIPALMIQTRYWRATEMRVPFKWFQKPDEFLLFFASYGYALVLVDVRGTGASFGTRPHPWSKDEIMDGSEIANWIVAQPWSNGKVGAIGTSYLGATAELLAATQNPAVKAVIPRFSQFDLYADIPFPGGLFNAWFVKHWAHLDRILDDNNAKGMVADISRLLHEAEASFVKGQLPKGFRLSKNARALKVGRLAVKGVKPADSDMGGRQLKEAIQAHAMNGNVYELAQGYDYRDDVRMIGSKGFSIDDLSIHSFKEDIERSNVGIYTWGSWFDSGTADGVIRRFLTYSNPLKAVIGPWNHGARFQASPYKPCETPVDPSETAQWLECLRFFDHYLKGIDNDVTSEKVLTYYTLGEEKWKRTKVWPPDGSSIQRCYLAADNTLSQSAPKTKSGADTYTVDFEATTGKANRWHTLLGFAVVYPDRAEQDRRVLTYTSPPLAEDTEITGYPIVTLYVTLTATDGAFFVYLEDVDENGKVLYITEGQLRAIHRKVSTDPPPCNLLVPYHTFKKKDAMPLVPGEVAELTFGLLPTSVLIRKSHQIRIAIAGHDKDTFARVPTEGTPVITVARNKLHASFIDLPVVQRS
ncbi:MAG: CocE/NonD family hydrolase [Candidatus Bathyarchaeota archaeon]|nr:CocE/NonD family hydrolase [Candidatus Bathyarchaeota archaeon]